ncbi:MAG: hypothetical protein QOF51_3919 [Chloroflexota bacterium]|jgi:hypothetical protein|nr:hypothetical protein [Chloroflexota bacterium]
MVEGRLARMGGLAARVARGPARMGAESTFLGGSGVRAFIFAVGFATFACGFLAGALLNVYLIAIHDPLVDLFRASLSYESAIFGDGLLLPIVNMTAAGFIVKRRAQLTSAVVWGALLMGLTVTAYFHVDQAVHGIVNWAMPTPWHWNAIGLWHALYMLAVTSWLSLFLILTVQVVGRERRVPREAAVVLLGVVAFFVLLRLDYWALDLSLLLPRS